MYYAGIGGIAGANGIAVNFMYISCNLLTQVSGVAGGARFVKRERCMNALSAVIFEKGLHPPKPAVSSVTA